MSDDDHYSEALDNDDDREPDDISECWVCGEDPETCGHDFGDED